MRNCWLLGLLLVAVAACDSDGGASQSAAARRKPLYFDLKGFLDTQTQLLSRRNPVVVKQVQLRTGQQETAKVPHTDWRKELQLFYQADINKSALRGAYTIEPPVQVAGGLQRQTYRRKPDVENAVERLTVLSDPQGVREVTATLSQNNALFFSRKDLLLRAAQGLLNNYQVNGVQKLILFDTLRYSAAVRVQAQ
ncbi:hypothetical protein [Hymenobacter cavernae]|uniref:GerMN domain-containing protein n=1 Tax=Hymenobacter cavernae TaxID=2044852 RepID=A0ABQ1TV33_9BACT|nr:hypothetical protein [Hymenobacter cavernae]GGF02115.1 hypothetical protein GCM10011383_11250 [Hymenobacter cavernae]